MLEIIKDTLTDAIRLLPFLFLTYLVMEYMEHRMGEKTKDAIKRSGRFGPLIGGALGVFPQCGFSAAASGLYAGRVITLGTLFAVFLSTSDEMLPVLISKQAPAGMILKLLAFKMAVGITAGFLIDLFIKRNSRQPHEHMEIGHMCEHEHCRCQEGILKSALRHTLSVFGFILLISFLLNTAIAWTGEDFLTRLILNRPFLGQIIAGLVGLIPNCAASVIITQLYLEGVIGTGAVAAGLLAGTGVGLLVLFRTNDDAKENIRIAFLLYAVSVLTGVLIDLCGIVL